MRKRRNWLSNGTWSDYHRSNPGLGSPSGASTTWPRRLGALLHDAARPQMWTDCVHLWKLWSDVTSHRS